MKPLDLAEYLDIGDFIIAMKAIHGPEFVNSTLVRHKILRLALLEFEKRYIIDVESELSSEKED